MIFRALKKLAKPFTGIPAPKVLKDDPWFGPAPILSEKQQEYVEMRKELEEEKQLIPQSEDQPRKEVDNIHEVMYNICLLYTSPSPRDQRGSRMPSSA